MKEKESSIRNIILLLCFPLIWAIQPTEKETSNSGTYESLRDYRDRLGIQFKYQTHHINPEMCRTLSEDECQKLDEREGEYSRQNRLLLTHKGREEIRRSLQNHPFRTSLSSTGTLNVLVFLITWSDHQDRELPPREDYEALFNANGVDDDLYPTGSIKTWFETSSYGEFSIQATVVDWVVTDNTELFYSDPNQGRSSALEPAFTPALEALEAQGFDFSPFDSDGDFRLDLTVFLHSGFDGSNSGTDCISGATPDQRIAAHAFSGADGDWRAESGYALGGYSVASGLRGTCELNIARIGVITHEMIHPFGLPDLYDIEGTTSGNLGGIGNFGIMSNPGGQTNRQAYPGHLCAWTRWFLGWLDPIEITSDGTYQASPVAQNAVAYRISEGYADNEFLLIENRQPIAGDYDEFFYSPGGIMIYHIDENVLSSSCGFGNCPNGGPYQAGWPENGNHYPVAVLQRDGEYGLEQGLENGAIGDVWIVGGDGLTPGSDGSYPNTDSYVDGNIVETGITINNFRAVEGTDPVVIEFDVNGLRQAESTPNPSAPPSGNPTTPPVVELSASPSAPPTASPVSINPTAGPSSIASPVPTETATVVVPASPVPTPGILPATSLPTSLNLTFAPATMPSSLPSPSPSGASTNIPSESPSDSPSSSPSLAPEPRPTLPYEINRPGLSASYPTSPLRPTFHPNPTMSRTPTMSKSTKSGKGKGSNKSAPTLPYKAPVQQPVHMPSSNADNDSSSADDDSVIGGSTESGEGTLSAVTTGKTKLDRFSDVKLKEIIGLPNSRRR